MDEVLEQCSEEKDAEDKSRYSFKFNPAKSNFEAAQTKDLRNDQVDQSLEDWFGLSDSESPLGELRFKDD